MASLCGRNTHQILDLQNVSQKAVLDFIFDVSFLYFSHQVKTEIKFDYYNYCRIRGTV